MKKHHRCLPLIALAAGVVVVVSLCFSICVPIAVPERGVEPPVVKPHAGVSRIGAVDRSGVRAKSLRPTSSAEDAPRVVATPVRGVPAAGMGYWELARHGELARQERRRFEAQKWEVDLAKALELPQTVRLERRSGIYVVPGFKYPLVRVDRVYRMDREGTGAAPSGGQGSQIRVNPTESDRIRVVGSAGDGKGAQAVAAGGGRLTVGAASATAGVTIGSDAGESANTAASAITPNGTPVASVGPAQAAAPQLTTPQASGTGLLDAGGGELVWENAMVADHLMVQVQPEVSEQALQAALPRGTHVLWPVTSSGLYLVAVPAEGERSVERAVLALNELKHVIQFAEPDFLTAGADTASNDPLFTTSTSDMSKQWHLPRIMAPRAWDVVKQPKTPAIANQTVVAVVDTGVDYTHPDLAANMWINAGESGGGKETNNTDDDGNGKIDDWRGWNFVENNNNPMDDVGHGTHVAGIIGAIGNNTTGGSGVCWGVKILPLRIIKAMGAGTYGVYSDAVAAMDYVRALNLTGRRVAVANHSWGGSGYSLAMLNAINNPVATSDPLPVGLSSTYATNVNTLTVTGNSTEIAKIKTGMSITGTGIPANVLVTIVSGSTITLSDYTTVAGTNVTLTFSNPIRAKPYGVVHLAAAGNSQFNADRIPTYPACLPSGFIMSVGATDSSDNVAVWTGGAGSNYGRLNVDLFAPGSIIWSTKWKAPGDSSYGYESRNGTSMAAPQVAGALALVRMWQPNLTELQARQVMIEQVDSVAALTGKCISGGRLNVAKVIDRLYQPILVGSGGSTGGNGTASNPLSGAIGFTGRVAVSRGDYDVHVLAIHQGSVWAWGYSYGGQLGGSYSVGLGQLQEQASYRPVKVPGLDDARMVAARSNRSYALRTDDTVWMWGGGDGNGGNNNTPAQIPGLTDVAWIAAEWAVKADGTVWNFTDTQTAPTQVPLLTDVIMVADGDQHRLALKSDGSVWAWGNQAQGKLGNGQTSFLDIPTPLMVGGLPSDVRYVAAGGSDSYAVTNDGNVYYWGQPYGTSQALTPTLVPNLQRIACISSGSRSVVAVTIDGEVMTWGRGYTGQLGSGSDTLTTPFSPSLVQLPQDAGAALFCSNGGLVGGTVAVITENDTVYCWGDNRYGTLGQGEGQLRALPTRIAPAGSFVELFTGDFSGFALDSSLNLYAWGTVQNNGPNSPVDIYGQSPKPLAGYPSFIKIDTSFNSRIGLTTNGEVWTWGTSPTIASGLANAVDVSVAGASNPFRLVALSNGTVWSWGENEVGQLGDGTTTDRIAPVQVVGLTGVTAVNAAYPDNPNYSFSLAIKADGTVWAWGSNQLGQLGNGTTNDSTTPVQVLGLTGVVQVSGGYGGASYALKGDGSVWAWGAGFSSIPQQLSGLPPIVRMAVSAPLFIGNDGRIWVLSAFGLTEDGVPYPKPVLGISNVVRVENTGDCIHALRSDGSLWVWGQGVTGVGSMGDGLAWSNLPLPVIGLGGTSTTLSTLGTGNASDSWLLQNFSLSELLNDSLVSDTATPAGDGIPNLVKYALGLDAKQRCGAASLPAVRMDIIGGSAQSAVYRSGFGLFSVPTVDLTSGKRYMAFTVPRNGIHLDIDYLVEVSQDLQIWNRGDPHTVTVVDTAETLEVYSSTSLDDVPRQFMRLKIQRK